MAAGTGSIIENADYNSIRTKIIGIMAAGAGQSGYGQTVVSSSVAFGNNITKAQWDALRFDIINARIHQDGVPPTLTQAVQGQPIRYGAGQPNNQYDLAADVAVANKWLLGAGQFIVDSGITATRSTPWLNNVTATCTITFPTNNHARWFFNSGGKIRISSSRAGGTGSPQNASWTNLLNSAGVLSFGGNTPGINFYNLTNVNQVFYSASASAVYTGNTYTVSVRTNTPNNVNGDGNIVYLTMSFTDVYTYTGMGSTSFPDTVDGTLSITIDEMRASGTLLPLGTGPFVITRPAYSITAITGT